MIILPFTIDLIQNIGNSILQAKNCYDFRAKVLFVSGVFSLAFAIPLGIRFGGTGCAFATGLSMLLGNGLVMNWFYARRIHLAIGEFWRQIGRISLVVLGCFVLGYGMNVWVSASGFLLFACKVALYTLVYSFLIYQLAMTAEERAKLAGVLRRK